MSHPQPKRHARTHTLITKQAATTTKTIDDSDLSRINFIVRPLSDESPEPSLPALDAEPLKKRGFWKEEDWDQRGYWLERLVREEEIWCDWAFLGNSKMVRVFGFKFSFWMGQKSGNADPNNCFCKLQNFRARVLYLHLHIVQIFLFW